MTNPFEHFERDQLAREMLEIGAMGDRLRAIMRQFESAEFTREEAFILMRDFVLTQIMKG